jgi:hypothetical protein
MQCDSCISHGWLADVAVMKLTSLSQATGEPSSVSCQIRFFRVYCEAHRRRILILAGSELGEENWQGVNGARLGGAKCRVCYNMP